MVNRIFQDVDALITVEDPHLFQCFQLWRNIEIVVVAQPVRKRSHSLFFEDFLALLVFRKTEDISALQTRIPCWVIKKSRIFLDRTAVGFYPLFVAGARAEIVDNVSEVAAVCLHDHLCVYLFSYLDFGLCVAQQFCEMVFDQIQVITPAVETENRHLVAPAFHNYSPLLSRNQINIFWYEFHSDQGPNVFSRASPTLKFRINSFGLGSQICVGSRSSVSPMLLPSNFMLTIFPFTCNFQA